MTSEELRNIQRRCDPVGLPIEWCALLGRAQHVLVFDVPRLIAAVIELTKENQRLRAKIDTLRAPF